MDEPYALAPAQERFWLLEQLAPGDPAHHVAGATSLRGALDATALQSALDALVQRHGALRTTFAVHDGAPRATIEPRAAVALQHEDLTAYDDPHRDARLQELRAANVQTPFDLTRAPLLRCTLVRLGAAEWQLLWCVHHIAADGLSLVVLAHDLAREYGRAAAPPAPAPQYDAFARQLAAREQRGEFAAGLAHMQERLRDAPATTLLPDHARGAGGAGGGRRRLPLAPELARALFTLGRSHGCTPFVTMLAGFAAALRRQVGSDDLVLGTPAGNRAAAWQHAVGPFVNSAVLRVHARGDLTFAALLAHVRAVVTATLAHGDVPFERLVQHLRPERRLDRNPLFQVMFNFVDFAAPGAPPPGLEWRYEETPAGTLFHFTLYVRRNGDAVVLEAEYDAGLFTAATIDRRLGELHTLLLGVIGAPDAPIGRLPLLPGDELATLRGFEAGPPLPRGEDDVVSLLRAAAAAAARRGGVAVADAQRSWTHDEVLATATAVAAQLQRDGVRPGDRVALRLPRSAALPAAMLGVWQCGGVLVPLDPELPPARADTMLAAARPKVVLNEIPHAPTTGGFADVPLDVNAPAYVLFTSGSSGAPKGVVVPHKALAAFLRAARATFPLGAGDVLLAITSPTFDIALLELLLPLCCGATVHVAAAGAARDAALLLHELAASRATVLQATPSTYRLLLAAGWRGDNRLALLCGGETMTAELAAALRSRSRETWNVYGPTETTIWSTAVRVDDARRAVTIGRPLPGTTCRVLDANGERAPIGCPGDLRIGGACVAIGYLDDAAATAVRFGGNEYRTGDRVHWTADGALVFHGRADDQVKVRGHRIELGEVEAHARAHPDVADAVATAVDGPGGVDLVVHVVPRAPVTNDANGAGAWRHVWQQAYVDLAAPADHDFDCRGWLDSRDGRPIAVERMRAWRDATAARVRSLAPRAVLEVGCGTGLVTAALAGECERWLAVDQAPAAVAAVRALAQRRGWRHVTARELAANALDELPEGAFDCVVLNSVVQYFPDLGYLLDVLAAARRRLRAGGTIFVGDLRLLPLHGANAAWIEDAKAPAELTRAEFAARCERRCAADPEMLVDPALFAALVRGGAFADHWIALKQGGADTEMDRFRADVVLTLDSTFAAPKRLAAGPVANARVAAAAAMFDRRHDTLFADVAALRAAALHAPATCGDAPVPGADGRSVIANAPPLTPRTRTTAASAPLPDAAALLHFANSPAAITPGGELPARLRDHLRALLPASVVPAHIVVVAALPRLPSGKVDRHRLPAPLRTGTSHEPPATATERTVAQLFCATLGIANAGAGDDFFALGGHSLAAAQLLARVRSQLAVDLPLRAVFAAPTVRALAAAIDAAERTTLPPLQPRPRTARTPPSGTMARLWFLQRLSPGSRAYLMWGVLRVRGSLDLTLLDRAVHDVVLRHEALRLRFVEHDGAALLVADRGPPSLRVCAGADEFERALRDVTGDELLPLQVFAAKVAPDEHRVAFVLHHAFADGRSIAVLQQDVARAYAARARGTAPAFAPLPVQYLDHAAWLQDSLAGARRERLIEYWRRELDGAPAALTLPATRERPAAPTECGAALAVTLPDELVAAARVLGREHGATLYHVLLAAFTAWLSRLAGQDDVVVGTTVAGRGDQRVDDVIGCFVASLPLRARLHDAPSFAAHVARMRDTALRALEHRLLPFDELVDAVAPPRSLARSPLYQATLDWFHDEPVPLRLDDAGLELERLPHDPGTSKFELGLVVHGEAPFRGSLEYRTDLFPAATILGWWRAFERLLAAAVAAPATPIGELPWLDAAERTTLLAAGRGPVRQWPDGDVFTAFAATAQRTPHTIALRTDTERVTYGELLARASSLAAELRAQGACRADRIAVHLPRGPDLIVAVLGVLASGAAYVPLDVELPPARQQTMLAAANVQLGICADPRALPAELATCTWRTPRATSLTSTPPNGTQPDDAAYVLFTSGSTGLPKGVVTSHRALRNYTLWARDTYACAGGAALFTPLGFDLSVTSLFPVLLAGGTVHLPPPGDGPEPLLRSLAHAPFGLLKLTPSHLRALLAARPAAEIAAAARGLVLGGEALDHELLAPLRATAQRHWNEYGPTEATVGCTCHEVRGDEPDRGPVRIGRPIANMRVYVLDEHRVPVPQGVIGEAWIAGAGLADGYLGDAGAAAAAFVPDPFVPGERMYRSGDLVSFTADFALVYHGRRDAQVKVRGHRIELDEVRALLLRQPGVRDAAAIVALASSGVEHVVAYVVGDAREDDLRRALAARLPSAAVPARIVALTALPLSRHGKLDTNALPDPWRTDTPSATDEASDDTTLHLVRIARDLLRAPELGPGTDFFRAGGDSILALQLVARAAAIGLFVTVADVFRHPRLADLRRAARSVAATATARTPGTEPAEGPLLPMQAWFFTQRFTSPSHYDQAIWLSLRTRVEPAAVAKALDILVARHAALRTCYTNDCDGGVQRVAPPRAAAFAVFDTVDDARAHEPVAWDPARGDVFTATFVVNGPDGLPALLLRAHHVAVDAVSWRIVATELEALLLGRTLAAATAAPIVFAQWLAYAWRTGALAADAAHFRALATPPAPDATASIEGDAATGRACVAAGDATTTHVRADALVIAATARAVALAAGQRSLRVDVEGHGRAVPGAPDVAATVGWFTTMYPVVLDELDAEPATRVLRAAAALRAVPNGGVAALPAHAPPAALLCNHLGVVDAGRGELLALADIGTGPLRAPANHRTHAFDVQSAVRDGALEITVRSPHAGGALGAQALADTIAADVASLRAADVDDVYPLTPTQQGMFFHAQKEPESLAYREQLVAVVTGALRADALAAAFTDVADRHELLRAEVHWRGLPEPTWLVRRRSAARLGIVPLASDTLRTFAADEVARPFVFGSEPLVRPALVTLAPDRHALVLTYHHAVLDGWSMPLLLAELVHCYRQRCGEALPPLRPAPRFGEHVARIAAQDVAAQRAHWRSQLAGFDTPVEVPGEPARGKRATAVHGEVEHWVDAAETAALQTFAREHGLTTSTLVAGAWAIALWRCSGRRDVLFGLTAAGRDAELVDAGERVGLFINTLPLRLAVEPRTHVGEWLRNVQTATAAALEHQHTPLPVSRAQTDVPAGIEPFETLLVFENYPLTAALRALPDDLSLESTFAFERTSYPLTVVAIPGERLCLRLLHDTARWSPAVATQLLGGVAALLRGFVHAPAATATVGGVPWLDELRPRQAALAHGPPARGAGLVLPRMLQAAAAQPDAVAIRHGGANTSYAQLAAMARAAAARLAAATHGSEAIVALCCAPSPAGIAAMLGAWWSGAAYLPLDPAWPDARLLACIDTARPLLVIADDAARARLPAHVRTIDVNAFVARSDDAPPPVPNDSRRLAYAIGTSGTTGAPKIVLVEHGSLANHTAAAIAEFALTPHDRVVQFANQAFDTAAEETWPALATGAALVLCPPDARSSSAAFVAFAAREQTTVWDLPTAWFHALADALPHARTPLPPSLRLCVIGGQACRAAAARTFLAHTGGRVRLLETYGPSEATIVATWCELTPALMHGDAPPPIGRPLPGVSAWVLGPDLGPLPIGMPGELCLGGRGLARGYLGDDTLTNERFVTHAPSGERLYRTGDRARWRADDLLEIVGRLDRQVKVSGVRVELDEIALVLQTHPGVLDAFVLAEPTGDGELRLCAHVEANRVDANELRAFVADRLPAAFVPASITVHTRLPRNAAGKVDARMLTASLAASAPEVATTPFEATVLAVFAELFPGRTIGRDDDFFSLGGGSLLAVRLLDALHARCGVELPLQALFAAPTPADIARAIAGADTARPDLHADARLPADFPAPMRRPWRAPTHVLLTGATGSFGRELLAALLARGAEVTCLVRAHDDTAARERLRVAPSARVHVVCGDVAAPDLGLARATRERLGRSVTAVLHAAAAVDFLQPYERLRDINVGGTLAVLRFCAEHGIVLHHVSSVGIFDDARVTPSHAIDERDDARAFDRPVSGYARSKWVAEQLVRNAHARGVATVVHRPGRLIAAAPRAGSGERPSFAAAALRLCAALGLAPRLHGRFDLTPIDWAAQALAHLAQSPHDGAAFHLVHPEPISGERLANAWREAGWRGRVVDWSEWRDAAISHLRAHADDPSRALLPFLRAADAPAGEPAFRSAATVAALGADGPRCPPIDVSFVRRWLSAAPV